MGAEDPLEQDSTAKMTQEEIEASIESANRAEREQREQERLARRPEIGPEYQGLKLTSWTRMGRKKDHAENEDTKFVSAFGSAAIFDGAGGPGDGGKASRAAAVAVAEFCKKYEGKTLKDIAGLGFVKAALGAAHNRIIREKQAGNMASNAITTGVLAHFLREEGDERVFAVDGMGDSNAYVVRNDGSVEQILIEQDGWNQFLSQITEENASDERIKEFIVAANLEEDESVIDAFVALIKDKSVAQLEIAYQEWLDKEWEDTDKEQNKIWWIMRGFKGQLAGKLGYFPDSFKSQAKIVRLKRGERLVLGTDGLTDNVKTADLRLTAQEAFDLAADTAQNKRLVRSKEDDITLVEIVYTE